MPRISAGSARICVVGERKFEVPIDANPCSLGVKAAQMPGGAVTLHDSSPACASSWLRVLASMMVSNATLLNLEVIGEM